MVESEKKSRSRKDPDLSQSKSRLHFQNRHSSPPSLGSRSTLKRLFFNLIEINQIFVVSQCLTQRMWEISSDFSSLRDREAASLA